ncbi:hypothetical protein Pdw03_7856 [Penicillium digitatum]|uniref:Uncharacterized protein n=2 Tax=Penicillium digitatum TaxID=36651 RepID=K9G8D8_PEND1|nr:hypothetical protein PDIP_57730 [Penicillium digitatum Pd1]EKV11098.1 hypothetical protein PDIP_57730 [Penicillium digitatum Pd1]QQK43955.1 hypothetical protein Pdw03_7856 [Penicillium digitatum]
MHVSYISLAVFAIGSIAAPAAPVAPATLQPSNGIGKAAGGFPFNPTGSSSIEDSDDGFDDFPSAIDAMHQALAEKQQSAEAAQHSSTTHPVVAKPTFVHGVANFPAPAISQAPSLSHPTPVSSQVPVISKAAPTAIPTPSEPATPGPLRKLAGGLPIVGGLVHGPLAGLGLRR